VNPARGALLAGEHLAALPGPADLVASAPTPLVVAGMLAGLAGIVGAGYAAGRRGRTRAATAPGASPATPSARPREEAHRRAARERWAELALTLTAAGIATAVAVNGMWRVFGDVLGFTGAGRIALAGFLEVALMVSAIRARRSLREHGTVGVDGAAVWVLALLSAVLAGADAHGLARAVRFAAPLVAAWLWERGLAAERRRARTPAAIAWRWTRERLAVRLGLAEPTHRETGDVDRARRLAVLTRARLRLAVLEASSLPRPLAVLTLQPVRRALAAWRLQRHALAAVEHLHLGTDPQVPATIRTTVAAVVGLREATAPVALATASPWTAPAPPRALLAAPPPVAEPTSTRPSSQVPDPIDADPIDADPIDADPIDADPIPADPVRASLAAEAVADGPVDETPRPHQRPRAPRTRIDDITARRARAAWEQAQDAAEHGTGAPLTGAQLGALLGVTDGAARKISARWRAERAQARPNPTEATS
jgi:hypothetical protein